jgi:hypothetical protein
VRDLAGRRAIVMLGSGVSANSIGANNARPPTWADFLRSAIAKLTPKPKHIRHALASGDFLSACEWIKQRLDDDWDGFVKEKFLTPAYKSNSLHKHLFDLDCPIYLTPNFDKIFDTYVYDKTSGTTAIKVYTDNDVQNLVRNGHQVILKAHGTIDTPNAMIFGRGKYAEARVAHAQFYSLLDAILLTKTVLIVGAGIEDPDFQMTFENFSYRFPHAQPHYMTYPKGIHEDIEKMVRDTRKIKMLKYSPQNGHKELESSLEQLVQRVETERLRAE